MGQYMRTALITEFNVSSSSLGSQGDNLADMKSLFAKEIIDNPESFKCSKEGDSYIWTLKPSIAKKYLAGFLKRYYQDFYNPNSDYYKNNCEPIIGYLSSNPTIEELKNWSENSNDGYLNFDEDEIYQINFNREQINIGVSSILLSLEGKVLYEELEEHLKFFKKSIRKAYADDPLGGGITVEVN
ncbi:MAG: hypothetical protein ABUL46_03990 [Chitinophaga rupis]